MAIFKKKTADVKAEAPKEKKAKKEKGTTANRAHRVLLRPLISEKATIAAGQNKYSFLVAQSANKVEIKKAIQEIYGVKPAHVNILNYAGKIVRSGRNIGRRASAKNAIVTLKKGDTIKLYEGT